MKLNTYLLLNVTKGMGKYPFWGARLSANLFLFFWISRQHPSSFQKCCVLFFSYVDYFMSNVIRSFFSFCLWFQTKNVYLSIFVALIFEIHIGITEYYGFGISILLFLLCRSIIPRVHLSSSF